MTKQNTSPSIQMFFIIVIALFTTVSSSSDGFSQDADSQQPNVLAAELKVRYARLHLELVETELKIAEEYNRELIKSLPSTATAIQRQKMLAMKQIPKTSIARLQSNIEIGQVQLAHAESPSTGSPEVIRKRYAEEKVRLAKTKLDAAIARKAAGFQMRDLEITRLDLVYQLAQLKLELVGSPENILTLVDSLQRQIDRLSEELLSHDQRITGLEERFLEERLRLTN